MSFGGEIPLFNTWDLDFPVVAGKGTIRADKTFLDSMSPEQMTIVIDLFSVPYFPQ